LSLPTEWVVLPTNRVVVASKKQETGKFKVVVPKDAQLGRYIVSLKTKKVIEEDVSNPKAGVSFGTAIGDEFLLVVTNTPNGSATLVENKDKTEGGDVPSNITSSDANGTSLGDIVYKYAPYIMGGIVLLLVLLFMLRSCLKGGCESEPTESVQNKNKKGKK